jgi:glycosyltransferase involved in cell wall biosynthesis
MGSLKQLTVGVITRDAAEVLPGLLASLPPEAELVVADGGSRDDTVRYARAAGARVIAQDLDAVRAAAGNFDVARNAIHRAASRQWILFLDGDERLTDEGRRELAGLLAGEPEHTAYEIPRINRFWGRPVRLLGDDHQLRLVRRNAGRFEGNVLHERMQVDGSIGRMQHPFIHVNVRRWSDIFRRFRREIELEGATAGPRPSLRRALTEPFHLFRYYYLENKAWRDGPIGLLVSAMYAAHRGSLLLARRRALRE